MNSTTGRAGVIRARDDAGNMDKLVSPFLPAAHAILDDVLYNVLSDLVMKTHREEKTARANTAAIRVEKLASDASDTSVPDAKPDVRVETDAAIYEDGKVLLKGNPLQTTQDILCPKCHLPRLLYPTDGKGARKPDPTVIYCKKHPYIDKPGCDIYGQSWVAPGPGRGKKKKDMEKKDGTDSPATPEQRPPNVLSFPSATCSKCKRCILVTRLNNHMGSCIGNSGRNASRAAAQKLNNGGSQHDSTPPSSQKATPAPGSRASSPRKRDASDDDGADSDNSHKKKKLKPSASMTKKVIIKSKPMLKKEKSKGASQLSQEQKLDDSDTPHLTPRKGTPKMAHKDGSPLKKVKAAKPMTSSPVSKNGREPDGESESSGTLSSPPGK
ncbi:transcriptional activator (PtaC) [Purpureocillium lilacinum]|uniref:Transcriptional activator (PtaC) n=1 Tax=Purpureocillium lilacinum TaxID=33203 RepID=A0A179HUP7_PURLI|nr:transcriptional activator (PtaC) [Purpureocillium lilacinum]OAQ94107.1 transcriptional activator (PtaC) [Purpureocillium lilacinum]